VTDIFGHIGYALILAGMFLVSAKNAWGWFYRLIGEVIWLVIGIQLGMSSMIIWGLVFIALDLKTFIVWLRHDLKQKSMIDQEQEVAYDPR
jgi:hypothetical protein